ncbi:MAG: Rrf2 family transcriptional regulator [Phycisphaeraceae bacterium]|nr:MAG: Rrf2 family transcriptional regulator [Phycisphaeraceae bacterium]
MISRTAEYAFQALAFLSENGSHAVTTREIAEATGLPADYLSKILRSLRKYGILVAHRGIGGGFALARPAERISVLDVLTGLGERLPSVERCPLGIEGHKQVCRVHRAINDAVDQIRGRFSDLSIADLTDATDGPETQCCMSPASAPDITIDRR